MSHQNYSPEWKAVFGKGGTSLWQSVQREYAIGDAGGVQLLAQACAACDRAEAFAACVERDGETVKAR